MPDARRPLAALVAIAFLAVTAVTFADVVGPGTTGGGEDPPPTVHVPAAAPLGAGAGEVADDLEGPVAKAPKRKPAERRQKPKRPAGGDWKVAKKAAKAECKQRFHGRERGQCISAAARAHKNPKSRKR